VPASPAEVERAEWAFYIRHLREGMVAFDVGAHVGELTLLFSRFVGADGRVHAFEASSTAFTRLKAVCKLTGRGNVILNHLALADKEGTLKLHAYDDEYSSWNSLADRPLQSYGFRVSPVRTEEVLGTTIDDYCEENRISGINLLKIDVEGAEYQVLLGARRMLESKAILYCVFEFGATTFDMGNDPNEIESYLRELGYEVLNVVKRDPVFPGRSSAESAAFSMHVAMPKG
jgi:FkbM family methyltransferase